MSMPTLAEVRTLVDDPSEGELRLSLFMPTVQAGPEVRQNAIRFSNLIKQAREQLERQGGDDALAGCIDNLETLAENDEFWQHQSAGLAILADSGDQQMYSVPRSLSERVVVDDSFDLLPLLPVVQQNGYFYVLAVSEQESRLLMATLEDVTELPADLPAGMQAVPGGSHQKGFGMHSFRVRPRSEDRKVPHAHMESNETEQRLRYLREIDEKLGDVVSSRDAAVVFTGDETWFAEFKEVSEQRGLLSEHVPGNPDDRDAAQLHKLAQPLVKTLFDERTHAAVDRVHSQGGGELVVSGIGEVAAAAECGQVDTVLYDCDRLLDRAPGQTVDAKDRSEHVAAANAVSKVLANGGAAVAVPGEQMEGQTLTALLRYA